MFQKICEESLIKNAFLYSAIYQSPLDVSALRNVLLQRLNECILREAPFSRVIGLGHPV